MTEPNDHRLRRPMVWAVAAAVGFVAAALVVGFAFGERDDTGPAEAGNSVRVVASSGETINTTLHPAPSDRSRLVIAAPSLNADETSLVPLIEAMTSRNCASVVTFDASEFEQTDPYFGYEAVVNARAQYGLDEASWAGVGASFTGLAAVQAAADFDGTHSFALSPSLANRVGPSGVDTTVIVASGDTGFTAIFQQWEELGYPSLEVDGDEHGSAIFTADAGAEVIDLIVSRVCS